MTQLAYKETLHFKKDFKKLCKRFKTLPEDLEVAKKNAIELKHLYNLDNGSVVLLPNASHNELTFYKLRKFACKALKGKGVMSGLRLIYALNMKECTVTFIEIYFKADKANNDQQRITAFIEDFLSNCNTKTGV